MTLGWRIVDAGRQLLGGEAAEHHGMNGADAGAGQHADHRLGDHRHIGQHAVALDDAEILQHRSNRVHLGQQLRVGIGALQAGDGAVVDQRGLIGAALMTWRSSAL